MEGASHSIVDSRPSFDARQLVVRRMLVAAAAVFVALVLLLVTRSITGQFAALAAHEYLLATMTVLLIVDVWRWCARRTTLVSRRYAWVSGAATLLLVLACLMAISVRGTPDWARWLVWLGAILHEIALAVILYGSPWRRYWSRLGFVSRGNRAIASQRGAGAEPQWLQRSMRWMEDGQEVVSAEFQCLFAANERQQAIHVVFCPPLAQAPALESELLSGPEATLKTTQCFSYGARVEVRLNAASATARMATVRVLARAKCV